VIEIANQFCYLSLNEKEIVPPLHWMKLQALVYYAQGWYLALNDGTPLFEEDILAYPFGPGVKNLEIAITKTGKTIIEDYLSVLVIYHLDGYVSVKWENVSNPDCSVSKPLPIVQRIWDTHKDLSHIQLMNSTHALGEPWKIVSGFFDLDKCTPTIPRSLMRKCFKKKIKDKHNDLDQT
jgi:uncharacterized phage-associated protein